MDRDIVVVSGTDALAVAAVHRLERGLDGALVCLRLGLRRAKILGLVEYRVPAAHGASHDALRDRRIGSEHGRCFVMVSGTHHRESTAGVVEEWSAEQHPTSRVELRDVGAMRAEV